MRFGCCLNMIAHGSDGVGAEAAPVLARAGCDYLEVSLTHLMALNDEEQQRVLEPIRASGLPCEACNNLFPASLRLTGPAADPQAAINHAERALDLAASLGAHVVVFGSGKARNPPEGYPLTRAWDELAAVARALDPIAAARGLTVVMEHLNRGESALLTSFAEVIRFVREVDRPRVRALLDAYHFDLEKEPLEDIELGRGLLAHAHAARVTGRTWPRLPSPKLDAFFSSLSAIGYDARMSVEAYAEHAEPDFAATFSLLKARSAAASRATSEDHHR